MILHIVHQKPFERKALLALSQKPRTINTTQQIRAHVYN